MLFPVRDDAPAHRTPYVTYGLIALNLLSLVVLSQLPDAKLEEYVVRRGFVPARVAQLFNPQLVIRVRLTADRVPAPFGLRQAGLIRQNMVELAPRRGEIVLSLFTAMFIHGGWLHLLSNMWYLWLFGDNIEGRLGHGAFFGFYLLGGVLASVCHWAVDPLSTVPVVGASGAIAAVLGAYAMLYPTANVRCVLFLVVFVTVIDLPALAVLGFWFVQQLLEGMGALHLGTGGGVAWWAHVGGFVAGLILIPLMPLRAPSEPRRRPPDPWYHHLPRDPDGYPGTTGSPDW
jgi:membrane associated rhomboid family serine protease